jgi:hypothetical protein
MSRAMVRAQKEGTSTTDQSRVPAPLLWYNARESM